jgi:uncharacterized protein (TIGR03086 family)
MPQEDAARFVEAADLFAVHVSAVAPDQWGNPTPCTEWSVRDLVNHVTVELLWAAPLLAGQTIADVGDRFDGDQLGDHPVDAFTRAKDSAVAAFVAPDVLAGVVHLSYGDDSAASYCAQLTLDAIIHGWDLAMGIHGPTGLPGHLVSWATQYVTPMQDLLTGSGLFGTPLDVATDSSEQTRLLAMLGRSG